MVWHGDPPSRVTRVPYIQVVKDKFHHVTSLKQAAPAGRSIGNENQVDHSCQEVTNCVALLENTARQTTRFEWQIFQCCGCRKTPYPAHPDAEQGTQRKELLECLNEPSTQFQNSNED